MNPNDINMVCGTNIEILEQGKSHAKFRTKQESGEGTLTQYQLWDGVHLCIMDLHLKQIDYSQMSMDYAKDFICINHCDTGLFEAEFQNGQWAHLNEGDSSINLPEHTPISHSFPLGRYRGAIIIVELQKATASMATVLGEIAPIDLHRIKENVGQYNCFVICKNQKDQSALNEIWKEFYKDSPSIFYLKLKCLELFHFLNSEESIAPSHARYYEKQQLYKVNQIKEFLLENLSIRYTLPQLSEKFRISQTSLKECFKDTYGVPISQYMREYRISYAEKLLSETAQPIGDIAHEIGYENQSKFTLNFKKTTGMTPLEYRNKRNNYQD
ncbi:MAG: AraC family transcriptional regulator [Eubacteriales bacterium]